MKAVYIFLTILSLEFSKVNAQLVVCQGVGRELFVKMFNKF